MIKAFTLMHHDELCSHWDVMIGMYFLASQIRPNIDNDVYGVSMSGIVQVYNTLIDYVLINSHWGEGDLATWMAPHPAWVCFNYYS